MSDHAVFSQLQFLKIATSNCEKSICESLVIRYQVSSMEILFLVAPWFSSRAVFVIIKSVEEYSCAVFSMAFATVFRPWTLHASACAVTLTTPLLHEGLASIRQHDPEEAQRELWHQVRNTWFIDRSSHGKNTCWLTVRLKFWPRRLSHHWLDFHLT